MTKTITSRSSTDLFHAIFADDLIAHLSADPLDRAVAVSNLYARERSSMLALVNLLERDVSEVIEGRGRWHRRTRAARAAEVNRLNEAMRLHMANLARVNKP